MVEGNLRPRSEGREGARRAESQVSAFWAERRACAKVPRKSQTYFVQGKEKGQGGWSRGENRSLGKSVA